MQNERGFSVGPPAALQGLLLLLLLLLLLVELVVVGVHVGHSTHWLVRRCQLGSVCR